ncbi:MAG: DUF4385 domain-containing protein [Sphingobacteriia bacterium]|nr:DUF4385 domain-containing protein [Sphingobacteriia bacterium]
MPRPYDNFDRKKYIFKAEINYRQNPEAYRVAKGEQGVLICEPYKSEILPYWRFAKPETAKESSEKIYSLFEEYLKNDDFIGADMARKFLQMGFTRSRRYYNYKGGKKYRDSSGEMFERNTGDPEKMQSSLYFYEKWQEAENNLMYKEKKNEWREKWG